MLEHPEHPSGNATEKCSSLIGIRFIDSVKKMMFAITEHNNIIVVLYFNV